VAYEVARALSAPLDVWIVRKVGAPGHEELGLGAVAEGRETCLNENVRAHLDCLADACARCIQPTGSEPES
jgi:putative phosphoribosyl transferase